MKESAEQLLSPAQRTEEDPQPNNNDRSHPVQDADSPITTPTVKTETQQQQQEQQQQVAKDDNSFFGYPLLVDLVQHNIRSPLLLLLTFTFLIGIALTFFVLLFVVSPNEDVTLSFLAAPPSSANFTKTLPPFKVLLQTANWEFITGGLVTARLVPARPFTVSYTTLFHETARYATVDCSAFQLVSTETSSSQQQKKEERTGKWRSRAASSAADNEVGEHNNHDDGHDNDEKKLHHSASSGLEDFYCDCNTTGATAISDDSGIATFRDLTVLSGYSTTYTLILSYKKAPPLIHTMDIEFPILNLTLGTRHQLYDDDLDAQWNLLAYANKTKFDARFAVQNLNWTTTERTLFMSQANPAWFISFRIPVQSPAYTPYRVQRDAMRTPRYLIIEEQSCKITELKCGRGGDQQLSSSSSSSASQDVCHGKMECEFLAAGASASKVAVGLAMFSDLIPITYLKNRRVAPIEVWTGNVYPQVAAFEFFNKNIFAVNDNLTHSASSTLQEGELFNASVRVTDYYTNKPIEGTRVYLLAIPQPPFAFFSFLTDDKFIVGNVSTRTDSDGRAWFRNSYFSTTGASNMKYKIYVTTFGNSNYFYGSAFVTTKVAATCAPWPGEPWYKNSPVFPSSEEQRAFLSEFCVTHSIEVILKENTVLTSPKAMPFFIFDVNGKPIPGKQLMIWDTDDVQLRTFSTMSDTQGISYISELTVHAIATTASTEKKFHVTVPVQCDGQVVGHLNLTVLPPSATHPFMCPFVDARPYFLHEQPNGAIERNGIAPIVHEVWREVRRCCPIDEYASEYYNQSIWLADAMLINISFQDSNMRPTTIARALEHAKNGQDYQLCNGGRDSSSGDCVGTTLSCCLGGEDNCQDVYLDQHELQKSSVVKYRPLNFKAAVPFFPSVDRRVESGQFWCRTQCTPMKRNFYGGEPLFYTTSIIDIHPLDHLDNSWSVSWKISTQVRARLLNALNKGGLLNIEYEISAVDAASRASDEELPFFLLFDNLDSSVKKNVKPSCAFHDDTDEQGYPFVRMQCDALGLWANDMACIIVSVNGLKHLSSQKCPKAANYNHNVMDNSQWNSGDVSFDEWFLQAEISNVNVSVFDVGASFTPIVVVFGAVAKNSSIDNHVSPSCFHKENLFTPAAPNCVVAYTQFETKAPILITNWDGMAANEDTVYLSFGTGLNKNMLPDRFQHLQESEFDWVIDFFVPMRRYLPGDEGNYVSYRGLHRVNIPWSFVHALNDAVAAPVTPRVTRAPPAVIHSETPFSVRVEFAQDVNLYSWGGIFQVICRQLPTLVEFPCHVARPALLGYLNTVDDTGLRIDDLSFPASVPTGFEYRIDVAFLSNDPSRKFSVGTVKLVRVSNRCRVVTNMTLQPLLVGRPIAVPIVTECRGQRQPNIGVAASLRTAERNCFGTQCGRLQEESRFVTTNDHGEATMVLVPTAGPENGSLVYVRFEHVAYFPSAASIQLACVAGKPVQLNQMSDSPTPIPRLFDDVSQYVTGATFDSLVQGPVPLLNDVGQVELVRQPRMDPPCTAEEEEGGGGEEKKNGEGEGEGEGEEEEKQMCPPLAQQPVVRVLGADDEPLPRKWVEWLVFDSNSAKPVAQEDFVECEDCKLGAWTNSSGYATFHFLKLRAIPGDYSFVFFCQGIRGEESTELKIESKEEKELFEAKEHAELASLVMIVFLVPILTANVIASRLPSLLFAASFGIVFLAMSPGIAEQRFASAIASIPFMKVQLLLMYSIAVVATVMIVCFTVMHITSRVAGISHLRARIDAEDRALRAIRYTAWIWRWRPRLLENHHQHQKNSSLVDGDDDDNDGKSGQKKKTSSPSSQQHAAGPVATRQEMFESERHKLEHGSWRQRFFHPIAHKIEHRAATCCGGSLCCDALGENVAEALVGEPEQQLPDVATYRPVCPAAPLHLRPGLPPRIFIAIAFAISIVILLMFACLYLLHHVTRWIHVVNLYLEGQPVLKKEDHELFVDVYVRATNTVIDAIDGADELRVLRQLFPVLRTFNIPAIINVIRYIVQALTVYVQPVGVASIVAGGVGVSISVFFTIRSTYRAMGLVRRGALPGQKHAELEEADEYVGLHSLAFALSFFFAAFFTFVACTLVIFLAYHFGMVWASLGNIVTFLGVVYLCEFVAGHLVNYFARTGIRMLYPRIFLCWSVVAGVLSVFSSVFSLVVRLVKFLCTLGFYFSRFDTQILPKGTWLTDSAHGAYVSLVAVDHAYNNPIMMTFLGYITSINFLKKRTTNTTAKRPSVGVSLAASSFSRRRLSMKQQSDAPTNEQSPRASVMSELDSVCPDDDNNHDLVAHVENDNQQSKRKFLVEISLVGRNSTNTFPRVQNQLRASLSSLAGCVPLERKDTPGLWRTIWEHFVVSSSEVDDAVAGVVVDGDDLLATSFGSSRARRRVLLRWRMYVLLVQNPSLRAHRKHRLLKIPQQHHADHHGDHHHHHHQEPALSDYLAPAADQEHRV